MASASWPMSSRYTARVSQFTSTRAIVPFRLLVVALLSLCVAAATLGGSSPVEAQDDIVSHFKYGTIGAEATGRHPLSDLSRPADRFRGQTSESAWTGLRTPRVPLRAQCSAGAADRHELQGRSRAAGRVELRDLPHRDRSRFSHGAAPIIAGMPAPTRWTCRALGTFSRRARATRASKRTR